MVYIEFIINITIIVEELGKLMLKPLLLTLFIASIIPFSNHPSSIRCKHISKGRGDVYPSPHLEKLCS